MSATTTDPGATTAAPERCGQCGAPAAPDQRYCLNCGFHRRNAEDPVARYLGEASAALARVAAAEALAAARRRTPRLGLRAVALLVALALLAGILIGNATAGGSGSPRTGATSSPHAAATGSPRAGGSHRSNTRTAHSQVKNLTGKSYVQQEQDLPSSVSP